MMQVSLDELVDALSAREAVLNAAGQANGYDITAAALPELTEEDRLDFLLIVAAMPISGPTELFVRGIEVGRELERRANVHRVES